MKAVSRFPPIFSYKSLVKIFCCIFIFAPFCSEASHPNGIESNHRPLKETADTTNKNQRQSQKLTIVSGKVNDAVSGKPLPYISINFSGSSFGTNSDKLGKFSLSTTGPFTKVTFSYIGYQSLTKTIKPGQVNDIVVHLRSNETQLKEVAVTANKNKRYRNKGNPAVELIQQVIDHKDQNRMESFDYLQYKQYERIGLSIYNLSPKFINGRFFSKYKFMLDTTQKVDGKTQTALPVYFSEKLFQNYYRKNPEKAIQVLTARKATNIIKFIDTAGLDVYMNRLYGNNIDIYSNNIFIITNQFLSPIADHAPDFYKFFIADTIQVGKEKLVELNFTPRNKGDLLFEGKLLVTLDGHYAVAACELDVNKQININFMRSLHVKLDFRQDADGRYSLIKSNVKADFGLLKNKGISVSGERTVFYTDYQFNNPLSPAFYQGKSSQSDLGLGQPDTSYWSHHRTDTLTAQQTKVYTNISRLENMRSFKRTSWIASTLIGGFADFGAVAVGPIGSFYSFNSLEGSRFSMGARTTPKLNQSIYLEGYYAYGTKDKQLKYNLNTYIALNKTAFYRFPNDYFKISYLYDVSIPGQTITINNSQRTLTSFHTGKSDYYLYNKIFTVGYVKDFENHFSYNLSFKNWDQQAAGTLLFQSNDLSPAPVNNLTVSELDLGLRYAPHEQLLQGTMYRRTIYSKYPIFNLQIDHGFNGLLKGSYTYNNMTANIYKRFYLSQLGYSDVTLLGGLITGKVPFPLLDIVQANQSFAYDPTAYNLMDYLEFVSDHYVGLNVTQSFNGFFLNKIPLIQHLKWREFLTFKALYGGLRTENNPLFSKDLYVFPSGANGANGTYALGNVPYFEAGAGIGNIFKIFRFDVIRRFNYLDHPGIAQYGVKFSFNPDL